MINSSGSNFFKYSPDACLVSVNGKITDFNPGAEKMFRGNLNQIKGKSIDLLFPEFQPDGRKSDILVKEVFAQSWFGQNKTTEWVNRRFDGTDFYAEVSLSCAVIDGENTLFACLRDISGRKYAENEAGKLERYFKAIIENAPDGIALIDAQGNFKFVSPSGRRIFGYDQTEEITGQANDYTHPDDLPMIWNHMAKLIEDPSYIPTLQYRFQDKPGNWKWTESTFTNLLSDVSVESIVINFRDITADILARKALLENEEKYRMLFNANKDSISISRIDEEGNRGYFIEANEAACNLLGYTKEEILSFSIGDMEVAVPSDIIKARIETLMACGSVDFETILKDREGMERYVDVKVVLISYHNQPALLNITRDITDRKRSEMKLNETNAYLENLINYANAPIIVWDPHFRITRFNHAFEYLTGMTESEVLGQSLEILFPPELTEMSMLLIRKTLAGERWETVEIKIQHTDQSIRTVLWNSATLFATDGQTPIATIAQGQDITKRKQAEVALSESEEKFRMLADLLPQVIFETDINGNFVFVNRQAFKIFGYPEDFEIIGINSLNFHIPEEREIAVENIRLLISGSNITGNEYAMQRKDGSTFPGLVYSSPIFKENKPAGLRGIIVDITERKLAEKKFIESEQRYRLLVETANEGILVGQGAMLKFVNPMIMEITGYEEHELLSRPFLEFIYPDDRDLLMQNQVKRLNGEAIDLRYHIRAVTKNKSIRWIEMGGVKIEWEGQPAIMNFVSDITGRKQAEEEIRLQNEKLRKINAEKDKFFSIIAHDIRSPFSGFLGLTQIMAEELPSLTMAEIKDIAVTMRNSATNLFRLLENLLQWSLIQQGLIPCVQKQEALVVIVEESIATIVQSAINKKIDIVNEIEDDFLVYVDQHLIQTVFRNLISNAVKFTSAGGIVKLSARQNDLNFVEIAVQDNGIGMSPDLVDQLFRLDTQTGRKGTEGEVSTGLGLLLCKEFIEKHRGKLWVESIDGKGTTFYFTLPYLFSSTKSDVLNRF